MSDNLAMALCTLTFALFIFFIMWAIHASDKKRKKRKSPVFYAGVFLIGFAIYLFPLGAIDLYEITKETMNLSYLENYLLWIGVTVTAGLAGILLIRKGRGGRK